VLENLPRLGQALVLLVGGWMAMQLAATDTKGKCRDDDNYVGQIQWTSLNNSYASE